MPKYADIELAFEFVSSAPHGANRGVYDKEAGEFLMDSDMAGIYEIPEDAEEDRFVEVPDKQDLGLGKGLVFDFALKTIPDEYDTVRDIFRRKGAYRRFKDYLARRDLLDKWFEFEEAALRKAILQWCEENGIAISEEEG